MKHLGEWHLKIVDKTLSLLLSVGEKNKSKVVFKTVKLKNLDKKE